MTINLKRILRPLTCVIAGVFNYIFLFLNYAVPFISAGGESVTEDLSAYECMNLGDESLAYGVSQMMDELGKDAHLTFLMYIVAILLIVVAIISAGLIVMGCLDLVKEFLGIRLLNSALSDKISKILMRVNFFSIIISSALMLLSCLINLYTGSIFGTKVSLGVRPGLGLFLLLILAIAAQIVWAKSKNIATATENAVGGGQKFARVCPNCGAVVKGSNKFCGACGAAVLEERPCTSCGAMVKSTDKFCGTCGAVVENGGATGFTGGYAPDNTASNESYSDENTVPLMQKLKTIDWSSKRNIIDSIAPLFPVTYNEALVAKLLDALKIQLNNPQAWVPMVIQIVIYLLANIVAGVVLGIIGILLPIFSWIIGPVVGLYTLCGIILSVLNYLKVFEPKDQE